MDLFCFYRRPTRIDLSKSNSDCIRPTERLKTSSIEMLIWKTLSATIPTDAICTACWRVCGYPSRIHPCSQQSYCWIRFNSISMNEVSSTSSPYNWIFFRRRSLNCDSRLMKDSIIYSGYRCTIPVLLWIIYAIVVFPLNGRPITNAVGLYVRS